MSTRFASALLLSFSNYESNKYIGSGRRGIKVYLYNNFIEGLTVCTFENKLCFDPFTIYLQLKSSFKLLQNSFNTREKY